MSNTENERRPARLWHPGLITALIEPEPDDPNRNEWRAKILASPAGCDTWSQEQARSAATRIPQCIRACAGISDPEAAIPAMVNAMEDALSGWRYIRQQPQADDLYGVGWERVERLLCDALALARGES